MPLRTAPRVNHLFHWVQQAGSPGASHCQTSEVHGEKWTRVPRFLGPLAMRHVVVGSGRSLTLKWGAVLHQNSPAFPQILNRLPEAVPPSMGPERLVVA